MSSINISVIIPVYRSEKTLCECIESVLAEKMDGVEIICVDDGSDDRSYEICEEYQAKYGNVTAIRQANSFAGAARNRGIDCAAGKYVAFMDADDIMLEGALEKMYKKAQRHNADFVKAGFIYLDTGSGERYRTLYSMNSAIGRLQRAGTLCFADAPRRLLNIGDMPWNGLYRRDFLINNRIRFNSLRCVNDHSFYIHCLIKATRIGIISDPVVEYRVGQKSSLISTKAKSFECQIASHNIVSELCRDVEPTLRSHIMQHELYNLFAWYSRVTQSTQASEAEVMLREFLSDYDEATVGERFLHSFSHSPEYFRLRYNSAPPRRPGAIQRGISCLKEHGIRYTLERLFSSEERKYKV